MLLIYLSGTNLFVGLENVELAGLNLLESGSDTVKDNEHELVRSDTKVRALYLHMFRSLHT